MIISNQSILAASDWSDPSPSDKALLRAFKAVQKSGLGDCSPLQRRDEAYDT